MITHDDEYIFVIKKILFFFIPVPSLTINYLLPLDGTDLMGDKNLPLFVH
jgi:hypothetical protein